MIKCQRTKKKDIDQLEKTDDDDDDECSVIIIMMMTEH